MQLLKNNTELDRRLKEWPIQMFKLDNQSVYICYPATGSRPKSNHMIYWSNGYPYVIENYLDVYGQYPCKFLL